MGYSTDRPGYDQPGYGGAPTAVSQVVEYHDRVRWGPILGGLVTALSLQLVLSALGAAVGLSTLSAGAQAGDVGIGVGIWTVLSILIALFLGGYATARASGPMSRTSSLINGAILWSTVLVASAWLLASGVSGAFGVLASAAGDAAGALGQGTNLPSGVPTAIPSPNISPGQVDQAAGNVARGNWWFALGSLLSLLAAIAGATAGTRKARNGASA